ncbi:MAG: hypothetical protein K6T87_07515 [Roseiflexus sp.]|uniref:hypothetical protein n=1 Tax=Roseiflexus sp. TaxID=2562120 RepID=UPI0025E5927A|nr:hypothetical protein [Roseiflexus sp.]MCL6540419.1 hypothetical protein [Roseiflexus sp.]
MSTLSTIDNQMAATGERLFAEGMAVWHRRFDEQVGLIEQRTDTGIYHPIRESFGYARALVQAEGESAIPQAERILRRALQAQERNPANPHYGGFKWMDEDRSVTDLNAVQFVLEQVLPFLIDYGDRISPAIRAELLEAVRLGAEEIARLNVAVWYTNITLLDILNTVLAGQVLGDERLHWRGRQRLDEWIAYTNRSGAVPEYNSPTYAAVDLAALAEVSHRAIDPTVRIKAQVMEERLWIHTALHYHHPTAQLAGPHSRAYHNDVTGGICMIKRALFRILGDERLLRRSTYAPHRQDEGSVVAGRCPYHLPRYLVRLLQEKPERFSVAETAVVDMGIDLMTFMTPTYALGTASVGHHPQNDRLILYYRVPEPRLVGVLFSRYIVNEKTFGSYYHPTDRSMANNLNEEGMFWGLQHENKSIALYGLEPQHDPVHSLKTEIYVLDAASLGEIWINDTPITLSSIPQRLNPHDAVFISDGDLYIALRPLEPSNLGDDAPILLAERHGELVLSIYNYYQGEPKRFWEYASLSGPFYRQNIRAGFILEVGERAEYGDFAAFRQHILRGVIEDRLTGAIRTVRYASGADLLELSVDLHTNRLLERRINGIVYQPPMLASPVAVQSTSGTLEIGSARLTCGTVPAWVVADESGGAWAASNPSNDETHWRFITPVATLESAAFGFGRVAVYSDDHPVIDILAVRRAAPLRITCRSTPRVLWNGNDVSGECVFDARIGAYVLPAR